MLRLRATDATLVANASVLGDHLLARFIGVLLAAVEAQAFAGMRDFRRTARYARWVTAAPFEIFVAT